jgi:tetratricopeptide (TPR) repeat protein
MNKTTIVAFLLLTSSNLFADDLSPGINNLESQWASIYYGEKNSEQKKQYPALIESASKLAKTHPNAAEPMIWQAILIATNAAFESPFKALDSIQVAKKILERSIKIEPTALGGAAQVTLGTLYYMTPGWPISFGNQDKAESLFKSALKINPNTIDSNYFYADFLLSQGNTKEAQIYFQRAIASPTRTHQKYADTQLKKEALAALKNTEFRKMETGKNKFLSLFSSAKFN